MNSLGSRDNLIDRITSRKFLLAVATACGIAAAWAKGALPPQWAAASITILTVVYVLVEGLIDAQGAGQ